MSAIPGALGFTQNVGNQNNGLDQQQAMLQARANNPNGIATQAYQGMANQGMGQVLGGIAQTKGLRSSAAATMGDIAGSRIQGQTAQNSGVMGLQEQQANQNLATNLLMNRNNSDLNQQNIQDNNLFRSVSGIGAALA